MYRDSVWDKCKEYEKEQNEIDPVKTAVCNCIVSYKVDNDERWPKGNCEEEYECLEGVESFDLLDLVCYFY